MLKISVAQINSSVGDYEANFDRIEVFTRDAFRLHADLVVFPECTTTGYPQKDLLYNRTFIQKAAETLDRIIRLSTEYPNLTIVVGHVVQEYDELYNAIIAINNGQKVAEYHKQLLPNKVVFDEQRYYTPGVSARTILDVKGYKIGFVICEDLWHDEYSVKPVLKYRNHVDFVISVNASPFTTQKVELRKQILAKRSQEINKPIVYVNQVGGQDSLIFDGASMIANGTDVRVVADQFEEDSSIIIYDNGTLHLQGRSIVLEEEIVQIKRALVLGVKDYFRKTGFKKAVLGLSGGIDSALTAAIAVESLGSSNVSGLLMPSEYSSTGSITDAQELANNLSMSHRILSIRELLATYNNILRDGEYRQKVTEENLQARARGNLLMAVSNDEGRLVLSTGNKSEMSVGYCTMYGDMCGGLSVIADVYKTTVYRLAALYSEIPTSTITKPPSAELRPDQKDTDSLPPYDILDGILKQFIERNLTLSQIVEKGYDRDVVTRVVTMVDRNEYKRYQSAPSLIISERDLIVGRRMPIANGFRQ